LGIRQIEVYPVTIRYKKPFIISQGASIQSQDVIVKVITDYEAVGWGESAPSLRVTGENQKSVLRTLDKIAPKLIRTCPLRIEKNVEFMDSIVKGNLAAKASIDIALHDILGKTARKQLFMLMGGYRTEVLTDITLSIKSPKEMAIDAVRAVRNGFKALKIKVGTNPIEDFDRIEEIRNAIGSKVQLRIDANGGWTPKQAIEVLNRMDRFNVQFVEQPCKAENLKGLAEVRRNSPIPVMADESVHTPEDALRIIEAEAADMINIKLMKAGGIAKARKIATVAEAAGIPCMIGCMGETEIGIAGGTHLAAAAKNIQYADLDSDLMNKDKLVIKGGTAVKSSVRTFSRQCGLGIVELDERILGKPTRIYK
jgi:L-alanine-DL-glutamate epimerase-like enolase superfamily enzyme